MGVKLSELVPKREIGLNELAGKRIVVDASNMLFQFLSSIRGIDGTPLMDSKNRITSHLMGLSTRISNLIQRKIEVAFVFDGKAPRLKIREKEEREYRKRLAEKKFEEAKNEEDVESMYKYSKQTARITYKIIDESKEFLQALGCPVIQAPSEADAQAAYICENKDCYAVASTDYDTLLFGAPRMLINLTVSQRRKIRGIYVSVSPELIELKEVLKKLKIKQDMLIALGILTGTDYNVGGVKGIGPKTALKIVREHKNFDEIFKGIKAEFNWKEIYATFKSMPVMKNYQLNWKDPDEEKIREILLDRDFSHERVEKLISRLTGRKDKEQKGLGSFT